VWFTNLLFIRDTHMSQIELSAINCTAPWSGSAERCGLRLALRTLPACWQCLTPIGGKNCTDTEKFTHCNTLQHTATHCNTLQHTATHCLMPIGGKNCTDTEKFAKKYTVTKNSTTSVLQCVAVCCSVLQCVAVCCSVLQCVAVCCCVMCVCTANTVALHLQIGS